MIITHRGLEPDIANFFSESSFESFQNHLNRGFSIEFDPNILKDGTIAVIHDTTLERATQGKDKRQIQELTNEEIKKVQLKKGRIPMLEEILELIRKNNVRYNAIHLKGRFQTLKHINTFIEYLKNNQDLINEKKIFVFDIKPETAQILRHALPNLILAPSIAHPFDIKRYNHTIFETLITPEEAINLKTLYGVDNDMWVWGDEWDLQDERKKTKKFYTKELFKMFHAEGVKVAVVTPELHGTSPGLYGGESHEDAKDIKRLFKRIEEIIDFGADAICTDHPEKFKKSYL